MRADVDEKELSKQNENRNEDPNTEAFVFSFPDKPDWCGTTFPPAPVEEPVDFPDDDGCGTPFPDKPDGTVELPNLSATFPFGGVEEPPDWLKNETGWMIETG